MHMLSRNKIKNPEEQKLGEGGDDKQVIKLMWPYVNQVRMQLLQVQNQSNVDKHRTAVCKTATKQTKMALFHQNVTNLTPR